MTSYLKNVELSESALLVIADALSAKAKKYEDAATKKPEEFQCIARETRMLSKLFDSAFRALGSNDVKLNISITPREKYDHE